LLQDDLTMKFESWMYVLI